MPFSCCWQTVGSRIRPWLDFLIVQDQNISYKHSTHGLQNWKSRYLWPSSDQLEKKNHLKTTGGKKHTNTQLQTNPPCIFFIKCARFYPDTKCSIHGKDTDSPVTFPVFCCSVQLKLWSFGNPRFSGRKVYWSHSVEARDHWYDAQWLIWSNDTLRTGHKLYWYLQRQAVSCVLITTKILKKNPKKTWRLMNTCQYYCKVS